MAAKLEDERIRSRLEQGKRDRDAKLKTLKWLDRRERCIRSDISHRKERLDVLKRSLDKLMMISSSKPHELLVKFQMLHGKRKSLAQESKLLKQLDISAIVEGANWRSKKKDIQSEIQVIGRELEEARKEYLEAKDEIGRVLRELELIKVEMRWLQKQVMQLWSTRLEKQGCLVYPSSAAIHWLGLAKEIMVREYYSTPLETKRS